MPQDRSPLKKIVGDQALEIQMLKEIAKGN
jgi:hypothetical protein